MFISGTAAGSAYRAGSNAGMAAGAKMSSAVRGLIPKSTGGRVGMGIGAALGGAAVLAAHRNRRSSGAGFNQTAFGQDVAQAISSGRLAAPQGAASMVNLRSGQSYDL